MSALKHCCSIKYAIIFTFIILTFAALATAEDISYTLDNGMTVILKENHSSPMVASMVFVKSGSKYESEYENGITHFLEHLLFDGTSNLTREELDKSITDLGGYINAFTRKEMTAYLVLLPKQYIDYGMTVQADMLFNSLIPDEELPKERKVVIEEINRDKDSPGYAPDKFFYEKAYANTDYQQPVLGYKAFIENIPREAIVTYWKKYYRPENMTLLVIGDFNTEAMKTEVANLWGKINLAAVADTMTTEKMIGDDYGQLAGQNVYDTVAEVKSTYLNFSFTAPHYTDSDYFAIDLMAQYLALDGISPLMTALKGGAEPLATEASIGLSTYEEFSRLEVSVVTNDDSKTAEIVSTVIDKISSVSEMMADNEALEGIKTSVKAEDTYNSEKLHYLGFLVGPMMMTTGWDFVQSYPDKLAQVSWTQCQTAAKRFYDEANFVATLVHPLKEGQTAYTPYEMADGEVIAHFAAATFPDYSADSGIVLMFPPTDSVEFVLEDRATYHREVFDNGLTVIIKQNPDSKVFGLNVIGKNRTGSEPAHLTGITDFVNRCVEKGTLTRDAGELARDLAKIGANVTLYDNPWIPYDDRYTSRAYSFMKFETIDQFAEKGFNLFANMILFPAFDPVEVENVRSSMMGVLGRDSGSPSKVAKDQFYATLFKDNVYDKKIMGTNRTIGSITVEDLKKYHQQFYSPANMIISVTSNRDVNEVRDWLYNRFGRLTDLSENLEASEPIRPTVLAKEEVHTELDKEQIAIYLGSPLPPANDPDEAALELATSILSERLYLNLREKQGLAYSVGAGAGFDRSCGWYYCSIGTGSENYQTALEGIILQIEKLKFDGPTQEEIKRTKNKIWGRLMSSKLSSINQAYYLGLNEYLNRSVDYDKTYLESLEKVTFDDIRRVASVYFRTDNYILSSAGKKQ